jgi:hypothetical protein
LYLNLKLQRVLPVLPGRPGAISLPRFVRSGLYCDSEPGPLALAAWPRAAGALALAYTLYSPSRPMRGNQAVLPTPQVRRPHPFNQGVGTGLGSIWDGILPSGSGFSSGSGCSSSSLFELHVFSLSALVDRVFTGLKRVVKPEFVVFLQVQVLVNGLRPGACQWPAGRRAGPGPSRPRPVATAGRRRGDRVQVVL